MKNLRLKFLIAFGIAILFIPQSCSRFDFLEEEFDLDKPKEKEVRFEMETISYLKKSTDSEGAIAQVREQATAHRSKMHLMLFKDGSTYLETTKMASKNKFVGQDDIPIGDYNQVHKTVLYNSTLTSYNKQGLKIAQLEVPAININKPQDPIHTQARKQSISSLIDEARQNGSIITDLGNGLIRIRMNGIPDNTAFKTQANYEETLASNLLMENVIDVENQLLVATSLYTTSGEQLGYYAYNYQVLEGGELALRVIYQEMNVVINVPAENVPEGFVPVIETQVTETRFENMEVIY